MTQQKRPLDEILDRASEEVRQWPEWMRSDEHRREMERIKRERAAAKPETDPASR